jgi:hypothetical protein
MLSEAKHLGLSVENNLRFFAPLRMTEKTICASTLQRFNGLTFQRNRHA